ncbi:uncharacterized protein LOC135144153 isoform X5 [Zophobas morio]|uniref:uncharacterized protein LOC135144153 isoform X5 n=1 Tax=Zophobas morio TaxID=2755281 RepID=UPI0030832BA2
MKIIAQCKNHAPTGWQFSRYIIYFYFSCWQNFIMTTLSASSTRQIFCAGHKELQHPTFIQMQDHRIIWSQKPQNVFSRIRNFPLIGLTGNCIRYKYLSLIN